MREMPSARATAPGPLPLETPSATPVDPRVAVRVDARLLGFGNALGLAFAAHVGLELGEHRQHAEEGTPGRGAGINALFDHSKVGACRLDLVRDVGEIAQ
jgi:hypothetical protein